MPQSRFDPPVSPELHVSGSSVNISLTEWVFTNKLPKYICRCGVAQKYDLGGGLLIWLQGDFVVSEKALNGSPRRVLSAVCLSALFVTLLSFSPEAAAQQASANINGTVTDSTGAVVEGAEIALANVQTGVVRTSVSNTSGNYGFVDVLPAPYTIKVTKVGFSTINQPQFTMNVNQTATFDFHLAVGSAQQTVTVEATSVAIQSSTAELGTVINEQSVNQLPLNGRNFTQLLTFDSGRKPCQCRPEF